MHLSLIQLAQVYNDSSDDGGMGLRFLFGGFWVILLAAFCVWVNGDSRRNQIPCFGTKFDVEKDPAIWAVICFFFCPAFLYYFYRRSNVFYERGRDVTQEAYIHTQAQNFTKAPVVLQAAAQPSVSQTMDEQLETLWKLKEKGFISEEEWQQKKKQIVGL